MDTRERLLLTAERLFAERGLHGVSMREITREAGQKNVSALYYHFGSRNEVIEAIFEKRMNGIDARRRKMLETVESVEASDRLRAVVAALVWPIAERLFEPEDSRHYVRFLANVLNSPNTKIGEMVGEKFDHGLRRAFVLIRDMVPDVAEPLLRQRFLLIQHNTAFALIGMELAMARRHESGGVFDLERAVENLIDMTVAAIAAPVTEKTRALLDKVRAA